MQQMIDWEYYCSHFPAPVPEELFPAVEAQAQEELKRIVPGYRLKQIGESRKKSAVFKLCNFLYENRNAVSGSSLSGVSNDGYSESYKVRTQEETEQAIRELVYSCIGTRLAGAF